MTVRDQAEGLRRLVADAPCARPPRAFAGTEAGGIVLVVSPDTKSILGAYAAIKHAARDAAARGVSLLVTGVRGERDALAIHRNIAAAARDHLRVEVELIGYLTCESAGSEG
jgi:MinD-like ATPase involved in chromosome partitioning or flagellar assembly